MAKRRTSARKSSRSAAVVSKRRPTRTAKHGRRAPAGQTSKSGAQVARKARATAKSTLAPGKKSGPARRKTAPAKAQAPGRGRQAPKHRVPERKAHGPTPSVRRKLRATTRPKTRSARQAAKAPAARPTPTGRARRPRGVPQPAGAATHDRRQKTPVPSLPLAAEPLTVEDESELPLVETPTSFTVDLRRTRDARATLEETFDVDPDSAAALAAGDCEVRFEVASTVGDETPGGDNPTPDMDVVDLIGRSLGVEYKDDEELKGADKIAERDRKRWELDPKSSEDFKDRRR